MSGSIGESELRRLALQVLASRPSGFISTSDLIVELTEILKPTGRDAKILNGRSDTYFSQKVRNLVSHRFASTGLEARGLAIYDPDREGWTITDTGRRLAS